MEPLVRPCVTTWAPADVSARLDGAAVAAEAPLVAMVRRPVAAPATVRIEQGIVTVTTMRISAPAVFSSCIGAAIEATAMNPRRYGVFYRSGAECPWHMPCHGWQAEESR